MHPGNIFVLIDDPRQPRYAAVDFGIVGSLDLGDQRYLAENFLAVFDRDYRRVAQLHVQAGWVPAHTRIDEMESAVRTICEPIFNRPLKEISFGTVLLRLFEALRRFDGQIQPQLILLQKTLLNVEGLGRQLYPELDIWQTAAPVLRSWMREQSGPRALWRSVRRQLPDVLEIARALPPLLTRMIEQSRHGKLRLPVQSEAIDALQRSAARDDLRRDLLISGGLLTVAGLLWAGLALNPPWPGWLAAAAGVALGLSAWRRRP